MHTWPCWNGNDIKRLAPDDPRHGTANGYGNLGCRCERCKTAYADVQRMRRLARLSQPTPERMHGTYNCYTNYACRCDRCREAAHIRNGSLEYAEVLRRAARILREEREKAREKKRDARSRRISRSGAGRAARSMRNDGSLTQRLHDGIRAALVEPIGPAFDRFWAALLPTNE